MGKIANCSSINLLIHSFIPYLWRSYFAWFCLCLQEAYQSCRQIISKKTDKWDNFYLVTEAKKSQALQLAIWTPRKADGIVPVQV